MPFRQIVVQFWNAILSETSQGNLLIFHFNVSMSTKEEHSQHRKKEKQEFIILQRHFIDCHKVMSFPIWDLKTLFPDMVEYEIFIFHCENHRRRSFVSRRQERERETS